MKHALELNTHHTKVREGHLRLPDTANDTLAIDILGSLPKSGVYTKILVVICTYSRFTRAYALSSGTAKEVAKHLREHFQQYGEPRRIISDNAGAFISKEFQDFLSELQIHHHLITPYNPSSNLAENAIKNVLSLLRIHSANKPGEWHKSLVLICKMLNEGFNLTLKERPYFLYFGRDPKLMFKNNLDPSLTPDDAFTRTQYARELVQTIMEKEYDRRDNKATGKYSTYNTGDVIFLRKHFVNDPGYKVKYPFYGPFRIVDIIGNTVRLLNLTTGIEKRASMRHLKIFRYQDMSKTDHSNVDQIFPDENDYDDDADEPPTDPKPITDEDSKKDEPVQHRMTLRSRKAK